MAGPTDDERWRTALEDAARPAGAALSQQTRSGRRNRLFLVGTVVVAVTAMAAVVAALGPGAAGSGGDDVPGWQAAVAGRSRS